MTDPAAQPAAGDPLDPRFDGETLAACTAGPADPDGVILALAADGIADADAGPVATEAEGGVQQP